MTYIMTMDLAGLEGHLQKDRRDRLPQSPQNLWSPHNLCHLGESPKKGVKAFSFDLFVLLPSAS